MRGHVEIDESGRIPRGALFFSTRPETRLADYQRPGISKGIRLKLTNYHAAILSTIRKARLIVVEIARRKEPFWRRKRKYVELEDIPREFDQFLFLFSGHLDHDLYVGPPELVEKPPDALARDPSRSR